MLEGKPCGPLSTSFVADPKVFLGSWPCCAEGEHLSLDLDLSSAKKESKKKNPIWCMTEMHSAGGCWEIPGPQSWVVCPAGEKSWLSCWEGVPSCKKSEFTFQQLQLCM